MKHLARTTLAYHATRYHWRASRHFSLQVFWVPIYYWYLSNIFALRISVYMKQSENREKLWAHRKNFFSIMCELFVDKQTISVVILCLTRYNISFFNDVKNKDFPIDYVSIHLALCVEIQKTIYDWNFQLDTGNNRSFTDKPTYGIGFK